MREPAISIFYQILFNGNISANKIKLFARILLILVDYSFNNMINKYFCQDVDGGQSQWKYHSTGFSHICGCPKFNRVL
jgi:hypothetical protein